MNKGKAIEFYNNSDVLDGTEIVRPGGNSLRIRYVDNPFRLEALGANPKPFQIWNSVQANVQLDSDAGKSFIMGKLAINLNDMSAFPSGYNFFVNGDMKATEVNAAFALENAQKIRFKNALGAFDGTEITRTSNDALRFKTVGGTSLLLDVNGNVGVNHLNPTGRLHIAGDPNTNDASLTGPGGYLVLGNTNGPNLALDNNEIMARSNGAMTTLGLQADGGALLIHGDATNESEKVLINSAGLVGIGNTNPQSYLHIKQAPDKPYAIKLERDGQVPYELFVGSSKGLNIKNSQTGEIDMVFGGDKNIGIGTITPTSPLHLKQYDEKGLRLERAGHDLYDLGVKGSKGLYITNVTDGRQEMVFDGSGKIGIGTDAPSGVLHVVGDPNLNDVGLSNPGGFLVLGNTTGPNLALDNNEIMARDNGAVTTLGLQVEGGSITVHGGSNIPESEKVHISNNGNVGIGTTPAAKLHIAGGSDAGLTNEGSYVLLGNVTGTNLVFDDNEIMARNNGGLATLNLQADGGTITVHAGASIPEAEKVIIREDGSVGVGINGPAAKLHIVGAENNGINGTVKISTNSHTMILDANEIDAMSDGLYLNNNTMHNVLLANGGGKVGIGTNTIPGDYKLAVNGSMVATELKVKLQANWPDYVFEKDYPLVPLPELEKSIQQKGHLPGIPNAGEVKANDGVEVGDMQVRLLKKVEELTLYIIQLEKRIHELEAKK